MHPLNAPDLIEVALLSAEAGTGCAELYAAALGAIQVRKAALEEARRRIEFAFVELLQQTGEKTIGDTRYRAGHRKITRCIDHFAVADAVLQASGGDVRRLSECLSSDPWRLTELRLVCGQLPAGAFVTETRPDLVEGKPRKRLIAEDARFCGLAMKGGAA